MFVDEKTYNFVAKTCHEEKEGLEIWPSEEFLKHVI